MLAMVFGHADVVRLDRGEWCAEHELMEQVIVIGNEHGPACWRLLEIIGWDGH